MANVDFTDPAWDSVAIDGNPCTVIAAKVSWTTLDRDEETHVSDSAAHQGISLAGNFTFKFEYQYNNIGGDNNPLVVAGGAFEAAETLQSLITNTRDGIYFNQYQDDFRVHIKEGGISVDSDTALALTAGTTYFLILDYVVATKTATLEIHTGAHHPGGVHVDLLSATGTAGVTLNYIMALAALDDGNTPHTIDGFIQNLDLGAVESSSSSLSSSSSSLSSSSSHSSSSSSSLSSSSSSTTCNWFGVGSGNYDSHCGDTAWLLTDALDGTDLWYHGTLHTHWFILDLGQEYNVQKVRGRSLRNMDPVNVNIYVSDDKENWGAAVASGINTWQDTDEWQEVDVTDKNGRYVKVEITATELGSDDEIQWGGPDPFWTIFDVCVIGSSSSSLSSSSSSSSSLSSSSSSLSSSSSSSHSSSSSSSLSSSSSSLSSSSSSSHSSSSSSSLSSSSSSLSSSSSSLSSSSSSSHSSSSSSSLSSSSSSSLSSSSSSSHSSSLSSSSSPSSSSSSSTWSSASSSSSDSSSSSSVSSSSSSSLSSSSSSSLSSSSSSLSSSSSSLSSSSHSSMIATSALHIFSDTPIEPEHVTDNSGSVLIQDGLEVQGNLYINSAAVDNVTLLTLESDINNNNEYNEILFKVTGGMNYGAIRSHVGAAGGRSYMSFYTTTDGGTLVRQITIQHDGKVGIGKYNPASRLDVNGAISSATLTVTASSDILDVSGVNIVFVNITGDIILGGLVGGVNGQVVHFAIIGNFVNHIRFEHDENIGGDTQDFINHTAVDEDISHGGCAYVCNGTNWYDISHARHV